MKKAYYNEFDPKAAAWIRELIKAGLVMQGDVDERSIKDVDASDLVGYDRCHFFAGIAGWDYALQLARWPDDVPVWTGSCPCQPYSVAGKGKGDADERNLWPDFFRLIRECGPQYTIGEQVSGAIAHGWLDGVCSDLGREGYTCGSAILGAHSVGAPHIRQRLYWVANASKPGAWQNERWLRGVFERSGQVGRLGNSDNAGSQGHGRPVGLNDEVGRQAAERHGSETGFWSNSRGVGCQDGRSRRIPTSVESGLQPLADGFSSVVDGVRNPSLSLHPLTAAKVEGRASILKGAGNAIVPQVAAAFVSAFMECFNEEIGRQEFA